MLLILAATVFALPMSAIGAEPDWRPPCCLKPLPREEAAPKSLPDWKPPCCLKPLPKEEAAPKSLPPSKPHPMAAKERVPPFKGMHAREILKHPKFRRIAPADAIGPLRRTMENSERASPAGSGFVAVRGCAYKGCPARAGFLAVDGSGGMFAAWTVGGKAGLRTSTNAAWSRLHGHPGRYGEMLPGPVAARFAEWFMDLAPGGSG